MTTISNQSDLKSKKRVKLDSIDKRILRNLRDDGRITNVQLSRLSGISAPPCLRRVRSLEAAGFIKGYHAELDGELLGYEVSFHALVGLDSQAGEVLAEFESEVGSWPEVRRCDMIRGGGDFMLRMVAKNTYHENELTTRLTGVMHVTTVQTFQVIRTSKHQAGVPIDETKA
ncbi:MAG: AsnC family transcriptional regulator [Alphaproteobacteria bacterium]|jgi:DNA-binding Lrp family transcriptional regulator|nr:AsnC family transcriptional regulator [Alphaproteobacteria bacterium]PPR14485.1 MAG: Leucine-responsive regulatory protein [Alphaproteobacteria bacterium MarineAlpha12_Bin1]|tara:strand:- start:3756 stop:4271 length:516 start_codon:yes stop_codon:yes gene_type:complete